MTLHHIQKHPRRLHRLQWIYLAIFGLAAILLLAWALNTPPAIAQAIPLQSEQPASLPADSSPVLLTLPASSQPVALLPGIQINIDQVVASGLSSPVQVTHAGDGSGRLFIVEQTGNIRILKNGALLPAPFLDLSGKIACCGERGLLGLAFHPDYAQNGYLFVNYTRSGDGDTVIARYRVSTNNPDQADPASALALLTINQPYSNHNGGQLLFSPLDGYLYIGMGDGGSGGDPQNYAQDPDSLLGKLLRLDVDGGTPYAIPPGNPLVGQPGRDEIWALGLRNPWRFSFDRLTGDLFIGDVGQNQWEEVDFQAAATPGGVNFGWRCREGAHDYNFTGACPTLALTEPIAEYSHATGRSISGGFVYRGPAYPTMAGRYFYADYVDGQIWSLYQTGSNPLSWSQPELELDTGLNISAFGEDEAGELYVADYGGGKIRRLVNLNGNDPDLAGSRQLVSSPSANAGEIVTFTIQIHNSGGLANIPITVSDTLPASLTYLPGSLQASHGLPDDTAAPRLAWQGNLSAALHMTITYQASVSGVVTGSLLNQAWLTAPPLPAMQLKTAVQTPRSELVTTKDDFFFPGSQPGSLDAGLPSSVDCDICHSAPIYDRWRGSLMSQAGRDPLMWAALHLANIDAPGAGEYCLRCHTPGGWLEGRSHPADGYALLPSDLQNGVSCALCHRLVDPLPSPADQTATIDAAIRSGLPDPIPDGLVGNAALIVDPQDRRRGPFAFNPALPYHSAYQSSFLGQQSAALARARLCGACHNVSNPVLSWDAGRNQFWPNAAGAAAPSFAVGELFPIETTFDEWLNSAFAGPGVYAPQFAGSLPGGIVRACQDCHMPRTTGTAADPAFNPVTRDCQANGCLPEHIFAGGNAWIPRLLSDPDWRLSAPAEATYLNANATQAEMMLRKAASLTVTLSLSNTAWIADVRIINESGHKLPTGYPEGRQMWLNLRAYDDGNHLVYESGAYDPVSGLLQRDPDIQVYEAKQGLTPELAAVLKQPAGESFHFVLNNTVVLDNRIPPRGYTQTGFDRPGLRPVGAIYLDGQHWDDSRYRLPLSTTRLEVRLYYQTASAEYVDFLRRNGGWDGLSLSQLWQDSKSPPVLMAGVWLPISPVYLPLIRR